MEFKNVDIKLVSPSLYNPRKDLQPGDEEYESLKKSIDKFGLVDPLIWNKKSGNLVGGHQRFKIIKERGDKTVHVSVVDLDEKDEKALNVALNKISGEWDFSKLKDILVDLDQADYDLGLTGFDMDELKAMVDWPVEEGQTDEDAVPEPPKKAITKPGDIWKLGDNRIMCGDSTKPDDLKELFGSRRADVCFTSPPYALGKSINLSGNKTLSKKQSAYDEHADDPAKWSILMNAWFDCSIDYCSSWFVNVQPLAGNKVSLFQWINKNISRFADVLTWDKGHCAPSMAERVMNSRFEWVLIFGDEGAKRTVPFSDWRGTVQNVYEGHGQKANDFSEIHGATMPVHLPVFIFHDLCNKAKSVYEPFAGTGTTIIAAQKCGLSCFGMEISPQYVDVIVRRWEEFTGKKAVLETSVSFE